MRSYIRGERVDMVDENVLIIFLIWVGSRIVCYTGVVHGQRKEELVLGMMFRDVQVRGRLGIVTTEVNEDRYV